MTENSTEVKGIIIACFPYGEYGRRILLLTDRLGKITVFAKAAAKQGSRMIGAVRPFTCAEFLLSEGKGAFSLRGVRVIDSFDALSADLDSMVTGSYVLELADYFAKEGMAEEDSRKMLNLIFVTLSSLREHALSEELIRRICELRMLVHEGLYYEHPPVVSACSEACWNYVLKSPLSVLYDERAWKSGPVNDFILSVDSMFSSVVPHRFRSLSLLQKPDKDNNT